MIKKSTLSLFLLAGVVTLTIGLTTVPSKQNILTANDTYSISVNSLSETVKTANGNDIYFEYDNTSLLDSSLAIIQEGGTISNTTAISGLKTINATFEGTLNIKYKFDGKDEYASNYVQLESGVPYNFRNDSPDYFCLFASEETTLNSLDLTYSCSRRILPGDNGIEVTSNGIGIHQGDLNYIVDGNKDTYAWLNGNLDIGEYVQVDYLEIIHLTSIEFLFKGFYEEPLFTPLVQYSLDGEVFYDLCHPNNNEFSYSPNSVIDFRYLRLTTDVDGLPYWRSIAEITLNTKPLVTLGEGLEIYEGNFANIFDGNINSYCWVDPTNRTEASSLTIDYGKKVSSNGIHFYHKAGNGTYACFDKAYYSLDGKNYYLIGAFGDNSQRFDTFKDENGNDVDTIEFRYIHLTNDSVENTVWPSLAEIVIDFDHNFSSVYEGTYFNALDNDLSTYLWFGSEGNVGSYATFYFPNGVSTNVITATYDGTDYLPGIEVSLDGNNWTKLNVNNVKEGGYSISKIALEKHITFNYIKLINNSDASTGCWVKILDLSFGPTISLNGFAGGIYSGSLSDMVDDNPDTFVWFNCNPAAGDYILVDYKDIISTSKIKVLFKSGNTLPCFLENLEVSTDGVEWTTLIEGNASNEMNYDGEVQFRYLKLLSPNGNGEWTSVATIEFGE